MKLKRKQDYLGDVYSHSKLGCIASCMRKAYWKYVVKEKTPLPEFFLRGSAVHAGQEYDNRQKLKGEFVPKDEVLDVAIARYEEGTEPNNRDVIDSFATEHKIQLNHYWKTGMRDRLVPVEGSIEAMWECDVKIWNSQTHVLRPATLQGFVDVVAFDEGEGEEHKRIIDYKNVSRAVSDSNLEYDLQGTLYTLGAACDRFQYFSFVKGGSRTKPNFKATQIKEVRQSDINHLLQYIHHTITDFRSALKTGDFPKTAPNNWQCKNCEYRDKCYPKSNPTLSKLVSINIVRPVGTLKTPDWRK